MAVANRIRWTWNTITRLGDISTCQVQLTTTSTD